MGNSQPQAMRTGSGREIAMLVGVLALVAAGTVATYWVRSKAEASGQGSAQATVEAAAPARPRVAAPAPTPAAEVVHADMYFDFKSTRLRAEAARLLQDQAAVMAHTETWAVLVQGYADRQGPAAYNRLLAERRATTVKQFLVELGVPEASIRVVTIGPEGALCDEPTAECQQLNRRVHLEVRKLTRAAAEPVRPVLAVGDTLDTTAGRGERQ
jgi:outer membrane protein OmpA-like peptidoglycan-associated protein